MKKESTKVEEIPAYSWSRLDLALTAVLVTITIVLRALPGPLIIDDAYITFRYARNIVEGAGFVYNPGEHILGTTTPLYTLLMALSAGLTGSRDFSTLAVAANTAADAVTVALLYLAGLRLAGSRVLAGALGLLWATAPMSVMVVVLGMETSVYILWIAAALYTYFNRRDNLTAVFAAFGVLTRPDALIWVGPLFLHQLYTRWREWRGQPISAWLPWRAWLTFGAVMLPWLVFSVAYFGGPVPHSMLAKSQAFQALPYMAFSMLWRQLTMPFIELATLGAPVVFVGSFVYPILFGAGVITAARRAPRFLPFLIYPVLYLIVFSAANPFIYRWYLVPPLPFWLLGIVIGVWYVAGALAEAIRLPILQSGSLVAVVMLALVFSFNAWNRFPRLTPPTTGDNQEQAYRRIAVRLVEEHGVNAETVIASLDIGALGFYSNATILDLAGLVSPESLAYYPVPPEWIEPGEAYGMPTALILDHEPQYLVALEMHALPRLMQDEDFGARYHLLMQETVPLYGNILVFQHVEVP